MAKIIGKSLPNMPWENKPADCVMPVWRYTKNPILGRHEIPCSNTTYNSAVVPFGKGYAGVFRCDTLSCQMQIFAGFSDDAIKWKINHDPIVFEGADPEILKVEYRYDPRVFYMEEEDKYYITWCNGYHGPTIGVAWTKDFKTFTQLENAFLPFNRNGVMFPRKIGGQYCMMSRPSDSGHTPFGDIFLSFSPDMEYWGKHRHVMSKRGGWESTKIGAGPIPIETDEGWLLIYHGVLTSCNGFVYRFSTALLDLEQPWKVLARANRYILGPEEIYEMAGDVPNVCFPCATLSDADTGRIAIYYGCADTYTGVAFTTVDELVDFTKKYNQ